MTTPNISKLDKKYLTTAWLTMYVMGSDLFIISPLLPHIASDLNISNNKSGLLVSIFAIAYAIASPLFGAASDKYGRKNIIVWGLIIFTIANFLTAYSTNFIFILFSRLLAGISASAVAPSVYAIIRDQAPIDNRGRWLSIAGFGLLSALWTSAPFGAIMVNIVSWNKVFFILAILSTLLIWLNYSIWPKHVRNPLRALPTVGNVLKILIAVSPTIAWGASLYGLYTYLGFGLLGNIDFSSKMSAICFAGWGIGAICGNYFGGWMADRFSASKTATISLLAMTFMMLVLYVYLKHQYLIWIILGLLSFVAYPFYPAQQSRLTQISPQHSSTLLALNSSALYIGMTIGSILFGIVIDLWTFSLVPLFAACIGMCGALLNLKFSNLS